jgi:hypothetical protein
MRRGTGDRWLFYTLLVCASGVSMIDVGTVTNHLDVGAATNVPALYSRVRLVP